jgi:hypothetical protein
MNTNVRHERDRVSGTHRPCSDVWTLAPSFTTQKSSVSVGGLDYRARCRVQDGSLANRPTVKGETPHGLQHPAGHLRVYSGVVRWLAEAEGAITLRLGVFKSHMSGH